MKTEQEQSKQCSSNNIFITSLFYMFLILTFVAAMLHLFGLGWFESNVNIPEPSKFVGEFVKACLKILELAVMYRITSKKGFMFCTVVSILQTLIVGFLPLGTTQSIVDFALLIAIPFIYRKDKFYAVLDSLALYIILCLYAGVFLLAKFGGLATDYGYSFYANMVGIIDYKLFVITLYLYIKHKGGVKLWMKRKLFS